MTWTLRECRQPFRLVEFLAPEKFSTSFSRPNIVNAVPAYSEGLLNIITELGKTQEETYLVGILC